MQSPEETGASGYARAARPAARAAAVLNSAVYEGVVRHRRHLPRAHSFRYRIAQLYLDLDELPLVFADRWLWSIGRHNLAEFRRRDFLGPPEISLSDAVRNLVQSSSGRRPRGPIRLLTHLRYAGYSFNPVSFYYCYEEDGASLQAIVAEITNTPWGERHAYVLPVAIAETLGRGVLRWRFDKFFHVSPFMAMDRQYVWAMSAPGEHLRVHMDVLRADACEFDATLVLERRPLHAAALRRVLWRYPLMTAQVIAAIQWQALRLWLKRVPVHDHPQQLSARSAE